MFLLGILEDFVSGAEKVLAAYLALKLAVTEVAGEDSAGCPKDHAEEEDAGCRDHDDGSGREV